MYHHAKPPFQKTGDWLLIVESPAKCAAIESCLGAKYNVIASMGHITTLRTLKDVDIKHGFTPTFHPASGKTQHIAYMRGAIALYDPARIILATDADREGEAIAFHIATTFGLSVDSTQRITFSEITPAAIRRAVETPGRIDMEIVRAQHTRQVLDLVIGFTISPLLWKYMSHTSKPTVSPSAGRCQTPALRLIYENHIAEKSKSPATSFATRARFFTGFTDTPFVLHHCWKSADEIRNFMELSRDHAHRWTVSPPRIETVYAPEPLHTAALLQLAGGQLHYSPKTVMKLAQELYQSGYITYMRTTSREFSAEFIESANVYIESNFDARYCKHREISKGAAGAAGEGAAAHEAIRVANIQTKTVSTADPRAAVLYSLIRRATIQACMADATNKVMDMSISAPLQTEYTRKLCISLFDGWRAATEGAKTGGCAPDDTALINALPYFPEIATLTNIESTEELRGIHEYYTDTAIVRELDTQGIGRPSTFASFTETLVDKEYVLRKDVPGITRVCSTFSFATDVSATPAAQIVETHHERVFGSAKRRLVITPAGIQCVEFLLEHFAYIFEYEYSRKMESALEERGDTTHIVSDIYDFIQSRAKLLKDTVSEYTRYPLEDDCMIVFHKQYAMIHITEAPDRPADILPLKIGVCIDWDRLREGGYTTAELAAFPTTRLGVWKDAPVNLYIGKYGPYIDYNGKYIHIKPDDIPLADFTLAVAIDRICAAERAVETPAPDPDILRVLNSTMTIRVGRYGHYIQIRKNAGKPKFVSLKKFPGKFLDCDVNEVIAWCNRECDATTATTATAPKKRKPDTKK